MKEKRVGADEVSELSSELLDYFWEDVLRRKESHSVYDIEEDIVSYNEEAQEIYNKIYDIVDDNLNREKRDNNWLIVDMEKFDNLDEIEKGEMERASNERAN
jgi:hypothetical protein